MAQSPYEEQDFDNAQDLVRKRQRFQRKPKTTADLLGRLMARQGYAQQQSQNQLHEVWAAVIDPRFRQRTRVSTVKSGVLEIHVASSAVIQQLEFQKRQLLKQLQQQIPGTRIRDLRFRVAAMEG